MANTPLRAESAPANPIARRDMMAAVLIGGAALTSPAIAAPALSPFQAAMRRFEQALAVERTFDIQVWVPAHQASEMDDCPIPDAIDNEMTRLTELRFVAEDTLIATPAPHLPAAIWKIEYARDRWADFEGWPEAWWQHVMMDLSRLAASTGG